MIIRVKRMSAAGNAYARLRRQAGLPPIKGGVTAKPGATGPVQVLCEGVTYTLWVGDTPAPAAR